MVNSAWWVYIVRCADDSLYTGVARDVEQRIAAHNGNGPQGARYTRSRRPVELVYQESVATQSAALQREHVIKQLSRLEKHRLIESAPIES